jgi:hypothetical protein
MSLDTKALAKKLRDEANKLTEAADHLDPPKPKQRRRRKTTENEQPAERSFPTAASGLEVPADDGSQSE